MKQYKRIHRVWEEAPRICYGADSKFVFISDCHRGDGSNGDNFTPNGSLYEAALRHYFREQFTYIELGDGDDLWECRRMEDIMRTQYGAFSALQRFHEAGRLYMLYGNHDIVKSRPEWRREHMSTCAQPGSRCQTSLFSDLTIYEGLVLEHRERRGEELLLLHGHQADTFNSRFWRVGRFLVRHLWRPLELLGVRDPARYAMTEGRRSRVEKALMEYSTRENRMLVAGHTHRPVFSMPGEPAYFNDGCCVQPYHITAIEMEREMLSLVKWNAAADDGGRLYVRRKVLEGPVWIRDFFAYNLNGEKV